MRIRTSRVANKTAANTGTALSCVAKHPTATTTQLIACNGELSRKVDLVMTTFMQENGITASSIAIRKNGDLLLEQGYGYRDAAKTTALPANALFNLASTVKPITAAAVHELAKGNSLALNDHVFCSGSNAPCWLPKSLSPMMAQASKKKTESACLNASTVASNKTRWAQD